jgi:hypothetical protein
MISMSGATTTTNCPCAVSTIFIFQSPAVQTAAESVYIQKQNYDAAQSTMGSKAKYQFKTDFERMQYLIGQYGQFSKGRQ